ncbi:repressor LexA [Candidatus Saganbacteria bacterium CG08_land_8_20_14_0_20_45_16]|uniref:Repressor LexA n=1 Tax=Candidatus Saganbacteria bacterium CG08_land_8_20_14_0_20_45_16 TaxID=2014293 RepID=A0A2H0Y1Q3_UNCSA|nr:MAG: repressor LexA [Candidatus Saganbacteria bacterium CG08_land_8_20_14_0_20_45_16]
MINSLTKRQKDLLTVIYDYIKDSGYPPTFEEMRALLGVSSNQSVIDHLEKLVEGKFLKRNEAGARKIAILPFGYKALGKPPLVAFLGATSAGAPLETVEIEGEWKSLSEDVEKLNEDVFLLKISGDSMINAGIDDGDVVLVQSVKEFYNGDVVLAQIGSESTVKRFITQDKPPYLYLKPENPKYKNILFTDDVELKGKVISVLKNGYWKGVK